METALDQIKWLFMFIHLPITILIGCKRFVIYQFVPPTNLIKF